MRAQRCQAGRFAEAGVALLGVLVLGVRPLAAQEPVNACPQGLISEVRIDNHSIFDLSAPELHGRWGWAYGLANALHVRTRPEVIERELLFAPGECYDVERLRESERLLRALDFLADADIYAVRQPAGDVEVIVDTQDEWSTRLEPRVGSNGSMQLRGLRAVEDNLAGTGRHLSLFLEREEEERGFGVAYRAPQLFRSRWKLDLEAARTPVGHRARQSITHPFVGEIGRFGFREVMERDDRYFELFMPQGTELQRVWIPERRRLLEVGAAVRLGGRLHRRTVLGAALAAERISYPEEPRFPDWVAPPATTIDPIPWSDAGISSVRVMLLAGQRNIAFIRRRALDTVNATEDVPLGVDVEASLGPTLSGLSSDRDIAVRLALFAAEEVGTPVLMGARFAFEGYRNQQALPELAEWNDLVLELDSWAYLRRSPESRHVTVLALSAAGGWHSRVPFQLTLGGEAGMRGHRRHVDPGGRRAVGSLEHRVYFGWPLPQLFDLGGVAFVDLGRMWAGHAPFGTDSPVRAAAGVGLRAAFPPGSRHTFRVDLGVPLRERDTTGRIALSIGVGQQIGRRTERRDPQLLRNARLGATFAGFRVVPVAP